MRKEEPSFVEMSNEYKRMILTLPRSATFDHGICSAIRLCYHETSRLPSNNILRTDMHFTHEQHMWYGHLRYLNSLLEFCKEMKW